MVLARDRSSPIFPPLFFLSRYPLNTLYVSLHKAKHLLRLHRLPPDIPSGAPCRLREHSEGKERVNTAARHSLQPTTRTPGGILEHISFSLPHQSSRCCGPSAARYCISVYFIYPPSHQEGMVLFIVVARLASEKKKYIYSRVGRKKKIKGKCKELMALLFQRQITLRASVASYSSSSFSTSSWLLHSIPYSRPRASVDHSRVREDFKVFGLVLRMNYASRFLTH